MRLPITVAATTWFVVGPSLAAAAPQLGSRGAEVGWMGAVSAPGDAPTTLLQVLASAPPADGVLAAGQRWTIYMNRGGGTYTHSDNANDSTANRSTIVGQPSVIPPLPISDAGWAQVMGCVQDMFEPFNVAITDVDPGSLPHIESVVAGIPGDIGLPENVGGVSPFTVGCDLIPNAIVFTFAEVYGNDYETICEVVSQEVAHSFGLDHQYLASDPMTYLPYDGLRRFQDQTSSCGELSTRLCGLPGEPSCRPNQNSYRLLLERVGPADRLAPTIAFSAPAQGDEVPQGFFVEGVAGDNLGVERVELWIDGELRGTETSAPYRFETPSTLAIGQHVLELRVYDLGGNVETTQIQVLIDPTAPPQQEPVDPADPMSPDAPHSQEVVGTCQVGSSAGAPLMALGFFGLRRRRRGRAA